MKRIYAVIELADSSRFDPQDETDQDHLAEDLLAVIDGVTGVVVYTSAQDIVADEATP